MPGENAAGVPTTRPLELHLVSPTSGELVDLLARISVAQLIGVSASRQLWTMVRSRPQIDEVLAAIGRKPGFVLHTLADTELSQALETGCRRLEVPCMAVLQPFIHALARHTGAEVRLRVSARDIMDDDYHRRLNAMRYTLAHDDGLGSHDLAGADVVLIGVSRATKTPTCMYLAHRGIKAANIPLVPGAPLPEELTAKGAGRGAGKGKGPLIVGLTIDPARLATVRKERLEMLSQSRETAYGDVDAVTEEVVTARRLFVRQGWPVIDVTNRSIEQTAGLIMDMLKRHQRPPEP
jgi:hypothetical protein